MNDLQRFILESLQFTGTQVVLYGGLLAVLVLSGVLWARRRLRRHRATPSTSPKIIAHRTKHPGVDTWQRSGTHFRIGLAVATALAVLAINWTTFEEREFFSFGELGIDEHILLVPPPTRHAPPPPPPPPPPKEIVVEEEPTVEPPAFRDVSVDVDEPIVAPPVIAAVVPPPPPPPPPPAPEPDIPEIFLRVEQMPRFRGCSEVRDEREAKTCSERALFGFLKKHLNYPPVAKDNGIEGTVVLTFVVEKDGRISDLTVVRGKGGGLTEESLRVAGLLPDWQPGRQNGRAVRVKYTLPIKFDLQ